MAFPGSNRVGRFHQRQNQFYLDDAPPPYNEIAPSAMQQTDYLSPHPIDNQIEPRQLQTNDSYVAAPPSEPQPFSVLGTDYQFQYSTCTGRRKALLIGINYIGQSSPLRGCINDVRNMQQFLVEQFNYKPDDIVVLTDDQQNPRALPTRSNIIEAITWLVKNAAPNDSLFFHYSGHGSQTPDLDGDEEDGYDETILPMDHNTAGQIVDDELHWRMVRPLPQGCRLTAVLDCCHSGSMLDLPYMYSTKGVIKEPNMLKSTGKGLLQAGMSYAIGDIGGMLRSANSIFTGVTNRTNTQQREAIRAMKTSPADVISFSGCKDTQTSADTRIAGASTGALSFAFRNSLLKNRNQSYLMLLNSIRAELYQYSQKPQLSASHPIDVHLLFVM